MRRPSCLAGIAACFLLSAGSAVAVESNRLLVTVNKKTIGRVAEKSPSAAARTRRQTLVVGVTNQSVHSLPAGMIRWTAVVRKPSSGSLKYSGKTELPAMLSFKVAEVSCGAFDVVTRQSDTGVENDRIDYEVAIFHDGKETYRTSSVSNFAAIAEKAEAASTDDAPVAKDAKNGEDAAEKARKPTELVAVGTEKKTADKAELPVAEIAKPGNEAPAVPQKTFDFFNLRGKSSPSAK